MKLEMTGDWSASCDLAIKFKKRVVRVQWNSEEGYQFDDSRLTEEEQDELAEFLAFADTPVLSFGGQRLGCD